MHLAHWPLGFGGIFSLLAVAKPFAAKSPSSWHPGLLNRSQLAVLPPTTLVIILWQHSESGCKAAEHYIPAEERIEYRHAREGGKKKLRRQGSKAWVCQHLSLITPITLDTWVMGNR